MKAELSQQIPFSQFDILPSKHIPFHHISEVPVIHQLPLPIVNVPLYEKISYHDLPESRVPGDGIKVPVTQGNIFRDDISRNLTDFGGSIQLIQAIQHAADHYGPTVTDSQKANDKRILEKNATMYGYGITTEAIDDLVNQYSTLMDIRTEQRERSFYSKDATSLVDSKDGVKIVDIFVYAEAKTAAD